MAEVLSKSFRHTGNSEVSRKVTATLVNLIGPIARRLYDQFARVSVKSVLDRRDIVIDAMKLPEQDVKRRFKQLLYPCQGRTCLVASLMPSYSRR